MVIEARLNDEQCLIRVIGIYVLNEECVTAEYF